jgi:predicted AAA+ superfamily ATPase
MSFRRPQSALLATRPAEPRRVLHALAGPRQLGKTTPVRRLVESAVGAHLTSAAAAGECE